MQRLIPIYALKTPQEQDSLSIPGVSINIQSHFMELPADGLIHVPMNTARHTRISRDKIGQIYTTALAGCTGIAAVARTEIDTLAGVSHFDAVVDTNQRQEGVCASELFIHSFTRVARFLGAEALEFLVAYNEDQRRDYGYGNKDTHDNYKDWHFLEQLESLAEDAEKDMSISYRSYTGISKGHTLVASVDYNAQTRLEFS